MLVITTEIPEDAYLINGFKNADTLLEQILRLSIGEYEGAEDRDAKLSTAYGDFWVDGTQLDEERLDAALMVATWLLQYRVRLVVYVTEYMAVTLKY